MTKILFVSGTLPPDQSATANLIGKLIPDIQQAGYEIDGLTVKTNFSDEGDVDDHGVYVRRANGVLYSPAKIKCVRDFACCAYRRAVRMCRKRKARPPAPIYRESVVKALLSRMKRMPMQDYAAIVAVCAYYDAAEALARYKRQYGLRAATAMYQVDPLSENRIYQCDNAQELWQYEQELYNTFDRVFVTPVSFEEKKQAGWDLSRVEPLEFPLTFYDGEQIAPGTREEIKCVFAGYLYGNIRDARFTLDLFSKFKDPNLHLYMIGKGQEALLQSYENGALKGRLHLLGEMPSAECDELLADADVLINIGNTVTNQVPSKLFHYLGFGKPILNTVCSTACPTLPYTNRYPLAYNITETDMVTDELAAQAENWLHEHYRQRRSTKQISELFEACTPRFIVEKLLSGMMGGE